MSARPWRKRRNMTPRRWRKYVERGGFRRPMVLTFDHADWPTLPATQPPDGWVRSGQSTRTAEHALMPNEAWVVLADAPIGRITHAIIYPPSRR